MSPQPNKNPETGAVLGDHFPSENPDEFYEKAAKHEAAADELEKKAEETKKSAEKLDEAMEGETAKTAEEELIEHEKGLKNSVEVQRDLALKMRTYGDNLVTSSANMNAIDDQYHANYQMLVNQSQAEGWSQEQLAFAKQQLLAEAQSEISKQSQTLATVQDMIVGKATSGQPLDISDVIVAIPAAAGAIGSMLSGFASTALGAANSMGPMPPAGGYGTPFIPPGMTNPYGATSPYGGAPTPYGAPGYGSPAGNSYTPSPYGMPSASPYPPAGAMPPSMPVGGPPATQAPGGVVGQFSRALGELSGAIYGTATGTNPNALMGYPYQQHAGQPGGYPLQAYPGNNNPHYTTVPAMNAPLAPNTNASGEALKNISDKFTAPPISAQGSINNEGAEGSFRVGDTSGSMKIGDGEISGRFDHTPGENPPTAEDTTPTTYPDTNPPTEAPADTPPVETSSTPEAAEAPPAEGTPETPESSTEAPETDPATSSGENETILSSDRGADPQTRLSSTSNTTQVQGATTTITGAPMMGAPMMGAPMMGGMGGGDTTSGHRSANGKVLSSNNPLSDSGSPTPTQPSTPSVKANTTGASKTETNYNLRTPGNTDSIMVPAGARGNSFLSGLPSIIAGGHTRAAAVALNWSEAGYDRLSGAIGVFKAGTTIRYILATTYGVSYVPLGTELPTGLWLLEQFGTTEPPLADAEAKLRGIEDNQVGTLEAVIKFGNGFTVDASRAAEYNKDQALTESTGKRLPHGYLDREELNTASVTGLANEYLKSLKSVRSTISALIMLTTASDEEDKTLRYKEFIGAEIKLSEDAKETEATNYALKHAIA